MIETGSLSAAARQLGAAQPTVRRRIEDLGGPTGRRPVHPPLASGLSPTPAGSRAGPARPDQWPWRPRRWLAPPRPRPTPPSGAVRITASEVVGMEVLPPILGQPARGPSGPGLRAGSDQPQRGPAAPRGRHRRAHGPPDPGVPGRQARGKHHTWACTPTSGCWTPGAGPPPWTRLAACR
ncbi:hypothetical protein ACRAWD_28910 [Caulobacter segnis]